MNVLVLMVQSCESHKHLWQMHGNISIVIMANVFFGMERTKSDFLIKCGSVFPRFLFHGACWGAIELPNSGRKSSVFHAGPLAAEIVLDLHGSH